MLKVIKLLQKEIIHILKAKKLMHKAMPPTLKVIEL
jgi:hypothetical protein